MNQRTSISILAVIAFSASVFIFACKKEKTPDPTPTPSCVAGSGGSITIRAKLEHHTVNIPNQIGQPDTVWVKYNASDWSDAPNGYNLQVIGVEGEDHVDIIGLKCGTYFLYACGQDTSISLPVIGGLKVELSSTDTVVTKPIAVVE